MPQTVTAINITSFGAGSGFDLPAGSSGSPNEAAVTGGNLVLTTAANSQAGIAVYQTPFSAYGSVSFDFTYNSSGGSGANGLSFFLLNGDALTGGAGSVVPGGYGGGLGYSDDGRAGITDGWLGVGFDTFGNYADSDQGQSPATPAEQASPNTIGVRGSGSGTSGYAYLDGAQFSPGIDGTREVDVTLNDGTGANGTPQETLTVRVSTNGGSTWTTPISNYAIAQPVPGSLYFGFAASTGGSTDLHEIKAVSDSQLTFGAVTVMDTTTGPTNPATLSAGDNFSYTTSLFNNNTSAITTTLNDAAPPNATNLAWTITDGNSGQVFTGTGPLTPASMNLAMSSGDTDTVTITGTVAQNASSGNLNHTLTATSAASGSNPAQTVSVAIAAGGTTPTITTIAADQATTTSDQSTAHPFSSATIYDGDTAGTVTTTVTLADP